MIVKKRAFWPANAMRNESKNLRNGAKMVVFGRFWEKGGRYLSPYEISATAQTRYNTERYKDGGRFADVLAKTS